MDYRQEGIDMMTEIILVLVMFGFMYLGGWLIEKIQNNKSPTLEDFYLSELAEIQRVPGTGGMTLKEYYLHREKSLTTICENCEAPHSLRLTSEKTLTCVECDHQQSTWSDNHGN